MSFSTDDFAKALEQHDYSFRLGEVVRGKVASHSSDGVYVDIGGKAAAFLPLAEAAVGRVADLSVVLPVDEEREFLIIREQDPDGQVTLSIRLLEIRRAWEELAQLQEDGKTIEVKVSGVNRGGVTADVKGIRGFIPRSHLDERNDLESLVGQILTVSFLEVDSERRKLVLSQRLATQTASLKQLEVGQLVAGEVVAIKPFGVFIDSEGTRGLLHIKQISKSYVSSLEDVFKLGQSVKAIVLDVDEERGRVAFSTKVFEKYPGEMLERMEEVMAEAEDRAQKLAQTELQSGE